MFNKPVSFERLDRLISYFWKNEDTKLHISTINYLNLIVEDDDIAVDGHFTALMKWFFGCEMKNTIIVLKDTALHIFTNQNYLHIFQTIKESDKNASIFIKFHAVDNEYNYRNNFKKLISSIESIDAKQCIVALVDSNFNSNFVKIWQELVGYRCKKLDVSNVMASIMSVKDTLELEYMKDACIITTAAMYYLCSTLLRLMDGHQWLSHRCLANGLIEALMYYKHNEENNQYTNSTLKSKSRVNKNYDFYKLVKKVGAIVKKNRNEKSSEYSIDTCYYPIIKSGRGVYSLEFDVGSDCDLIQCRAPGSTIYTMSVGIRYNGYCSNITRTMMNHPPESMRANYEILPQIQDLILKELKPGVALSKVYSIVMQFVTDNRPDLLSYLVKNFGTVIGIKFKDNSLSISSETSAEAQENMTFNLSIALTNIPNDEIVYDKISTYTLWLGDTCIVEKDKSILLTNVARSLFSLAFGYDK